MKTERWEQIEKLFLRAIEMPTGQRERFVEEQAAGDESLRREVRSLLACDRPGAPLVHSSMLDITWDDDEPAPADAAVGSHIGPYRLERLLGSGGMGAVYLAERDDAHFHKQVAIKLLKRGIDTEDMLARFRKERQILADFDHPNIARLLDGGSTDEGLPYFVMEYVDGAPITEYCAGRKLDIAERLNLFRHVCDAVQYAHQNLVVHRDLKPGNILVAKDGTPKLLDFGIAKLIDPNRDGDSKGATRTGVRLMTPHYASPEQVMGRPISTATDVYALGAILYELLTRQRPHQLSFDTPAEIERAIRDVEPDKPSVAVRRNTDLPLRLQDQLSHHLEGDLDKIVLMAMRKQPQQRYASAAELSEDIRRHLEGQPVAAQEGPWTYRAGKFVRRNKAGVLLASLIVASLIGGIVATTIQARRSERRFQLVRQIAREVLFDLHSQAERLPGSTALQASMIQTVVRYLDSLGRDSSGDPTLDLDIADAYRRVAAVEGQPGRANLGQTAAALAHYQRALEIYNRLARRSDSKRVAIPALVAANLEASSVASVLGDLHRAQEYLEAASALLADATAAGIELPPAVLTSLYGYLANYAEIRLGSAAAITYTQRGVEIANDWVRAERNARSLSALRLAYSRLGQIHAHAGDFAPASEAFSSALKLAQEVFQRADATHEERYGLPEIHHTFGDMLGAPDDPNMGRPEEALAHYRKAVTVSETLVTADPKDVNARRNLADSYRRVGFLLVAADPEESLRSYMKALPLAEAIQSADPANIQARSGVVHIRMGMGMALHGLRRDKEAVRSLEQAIELEKSIEAAAPERTSLLRNLSRSYMALADALLALGDDDRALEALRNGRAAAERMWARAPASLYHVVDRGDLMEATGRFYLALASRSTARRAEFKAQAREWLEKSLDIWQDWTERKVATAFAAQRHKQVAALMASAGGS